MIAYCVESVCAGSSRDGNVRVNPATMRFYTGDEQRARDVAAAAPGRTIRVLVDDQIPEKVRANLERAMREAS
jgi:hypothetical protein